jgi:hypothetical protein
VLKKKVLKVLPVWLLALLLIGSAAAAFLWISNMVRISIVVWERPIFLESRGNVVGMTFYPDELRTHQINFTVNNPAQNLGYVVFNFTFADPAGNWSEHSQPLLYNIRLHWTPSLYEESLPYVGYPMVDNGDRSLIYVFEHYNTTTLMADGPFNFTRYGSEGYIEYELAYTSIVPNHSLDIRITASV